MEACLSYKLSKWAFGSGELKTLVHYYDLAKQYNSYLTFQMCEFFFQDIYCIL